MAIEPLVLTQQDARGVVTLTLNRAQAYNALSQDMLEALQAALDAVKTDAGARMVVIAAAGKAFCAGHDLKEMRAAPSLARTSKRNVIRPLRARVRQASASRTSRHRN